MDVVSGICHIGDDLFLILRNSFNLTEEILTSVVRNLHDDIPQPHNAASVATLVSSLLNCAVQNNFPEDEAKARVYVLKPTIRSGDDLKACVRDYVLELDKPPPPAPLGKAPVRRHSTGNLPKHGDRRSPREKLLGHIHSFNNELLCPREVQDTVACCVFAMLSHYPDVSHKELLDGIMYTQWLHERLDDSAKPRMWRELVNFQEEVSGESTRRPVSRTKLRGVIGLLKQAGVVCSVREADRADTDRDSQASDGDGSASSPTKVKLGYGVRTFDDVRVREDTKIKDSIIECGIVMNEEERARFTWTLRDYRAYGPKYLQLAAELVQTVFAKHSPAQLSLAQECTKQEDARSASRKIAPMPRRSYPSATPTKSISACQPTRPGTSPMSYASALRDSPPKGAETIPPLHNRNAAPSPAPGQFAGGPDWPAHYRVRPPAPLAHARAASTVPCHSPVASAYHRGLTPQEQFLSAMQAGRVQQSVEARIAILQQRQAGEQHPQMHQNQHHAQVHAHAHAHAFQRAPAPYSAGGHGRQPDSASLWSSPHPRLPPLVPRTPSPSADRDAPSPLPGLRHYDPLCYHLF